ncbi:hypothetical protein BASA81_002394 [Batrachochytrium salamandrivorans]|nr:hypothetical protein BASA81_002394 [Batrachochytrium salamandrivorans]
MLRTRGLAKRFFRSSVTEYNALHAKSVGPETRNQFWKEQASKLVWDKFPKQILDQSKDKFPRWFVDGEMNASVNCLDRHVAEGRGDQVALFYDSPLTGTKQQYTFSELLREVESCAGMLQDQCGVKKGDPVIIYMPMIPEAVISMLACARLGAVHSVVFGGFASRELAVRINDAKANVVLSASCGVEPSRLVPYIPLLQGALELCNNRPTKIVVKHRDQREDFPARVASWGEMDWDKEMKAAKPVTKATPVLSTDPLYVLFTSGSTGSPKGIVRDTGGYCTAMLLSMDYFMTAKPGDVYFAASDVGWVVGHSYIVYGPLVRGCSTVLYEGKPVGTPDAAALWRMVEEYKINFLFAAPTALRAVRKVDPHAQLMKRHNLSTLKAFFCAGERADPETVQFYTKALTDHCKHEVPLVDCFWQTETGWPVCGVQDTDKKVLPGSTAKPLPGFDVCIVKVDQDIDDAGNSKHGKHATAQLVQPNEMGMITIRSPMPPGTLTTVFNNDDRYLSAYMSDYEGYYNCGDMGFRDEDGYVTVMSRNDDLINVAGHRLSTGTLEQAIGGHPQVAEVACVGAKDSLKGEVAVGFVVVHAQVDTKEKMAQVEKECVARVRELVGPVAAFRNCYVVHALPKTRSGKILRGVIRRILNGEEDWETKVPGTVEDVAVLHAIEKDIRTRWKPE